VSKSIIHICSLSTTDDVKGINGTRKLRGAARDATYAALKSAVLSAGRFSIFEATASRRAADLFGMLDQDPELEVVNVAFPWTRVWRKP
jgi:hypothetical protein